MAPDTISAHDVSVKILRRFRAEHSRPHHKIFQKGVLCAVLLLGSLARLVSSASVYIYTIYIVIKLVLSPPRKALTLEKAGQMNHTIAEVDISLPLSGIYPDLSLMDFWRS